MSLIDAGNSFHDRARRMHENRKGIMPSSIPYCMRVIDSECQLTDRQVATLRKTINQFGEVEKRDIKHIQKDGLKRWLK